MKGDSLSTTLSRMSSTSASSSEDSERERRRKKKRERERDGREEGGNVEKEREGGNVEKEIEGAPFMRGTHVLDNELHKPRLESKLKLSASLPRKFQRLSQYNAPSVPRLCIFKERH